MSKSRHSTFNEIRTVSLRASHHFRQTGLLPTDILPRLHDDENGGVSGAFVHSVFNPSTRYRLTI